MLRQNTLQTRKTTDLTTIFGMMLIVIRWMLTVILYDAECAKTNILNTNPRDPVVLVE
jgi:hypothetical protein